jgi:hypothetical protein
MGNSPSSPPPPAPSCPFNEEELIQKNTSLQAATVSVKVAAWRAVPNKMYYFQDYEHSSGGGHYCKYAVGSTILRDLKNHPIDGVQYGQMEGRVCSHNDNLTLGLPDGRLCAELTEGNRLAKDYCLSGENFVNVTSVCNETVLGSGVHMDILKEYCSRSSKIKDHGGCSNLNQADYNRLAETYCEANPSDAWCKCYNVSKNKCGDDQKSGPAGCADTSGWVDLRNATPDDFKNVWDNKRKCYGAVCVGANKYIPPNVNQGCDADIQICSQSFDISNMSESEITASCELESQKEGGGGGGGGGGGDIQVEELIVPRSLEDMKTFIPNGIDGIKTSRRQQTTVGVTSSSMSMVLCIVVLVIIVSAGGGGRRGLRR